MSKCAKLKFAWRQPEQSACGTTLADLEPGELFRRPGLKEVRIAGRTTGKTFRNVGSLDGTSSTCMNINTIVERIIATLNIEEIIP
jgi:hypothetical protein